MDDTENSELEMDSADIEDELEDDGDDLDEDEDKKDYAEIFWKKLDRNDRAGWEDNMS